MEQIADESTLRLVWKKEVRAFIRSMTLRNFNLVPDPVHYAAYDWGLDTLIAELVRDLNEGRYSPERGEIVRAAKGLGLSRPLCFLATRDALVYRTITWLIEDHLVANAPDWVGFSRDDKGSRKSDTEDSNESETQDLQDSFDWFRFWLAREGHILKMIDDEEVLFFVESDIANFFPSIRMEAVREHLHSYTDLQKEAVRLCVQIIDGVMPRSDYSEVSLLGLPQEQVGSSRAIAHSLLEHVDVEFAEEGEQGRYARYMDDIVIGVKTRREGERCIARLQRRFETLGLYPNASKTRVITVDEYLHETMVRTNGDIEEIESLLSACEEKSEGLRVSRPDDVLKRSILKLSEEHRDVEAKPRRWSRVTRRIYTLHRVADIRDWWGYWRADIDVDPGATPMILEYVRSWPLSVETARDLALLSSDYSSLYADIPLLAAEAAVSAPTPSGVVICGQIFSIFRQEFLRVIGAPAQSPDTERLSAAWLLAAWKFANTAQRQQLFDLVSDKAGAISAVRVQALPLLVAANKPIAEWVAAKPGLAWENALAAEYLRSLAEGEDRAVGVAVNLLGTQVRLKPQRFTVLPRAIPLLDILARAAPDRLHRLAPVMQKTLQRNPDRLRDHRLEALIEPHCP